MWQLNKPAQVKRPFQSAPVSAPLRNATSSCALDLQLSAFVLSAVLKPVSLIVPKSCSIFCLCLCCWSSPALVESSLSWWVILSFFFFFLLFCCIGYRGCDTDYKRDIQHQDDKVVRQKCDTSYDYWVPQLSDRGHIILIIKQWKRLHFPDYQKI